MFLGMTFVEWYWKTSARPRIFNLTSGNAELAHENAIRILTRIQNNRFYTTLFRAWLVYGSDRLRVSAFGIDFPNPLGLAAGFDKYCQVYHTAIPAFGWGSCDVGGICEYEQEGTPPTDPDYPRLRRSLTFQALWNKMGFNNPGADKAEVLLAANLGKAPIPIGLNVGKSATTEAGRVESDYCYTVAKLWQYVDYIVLNVSSPNTKNLRELQKFGPLKRLITAVENANQNQINGFRKPLGFKLAPDIDDSQIEGILDVCFETGCVDFIELTNTTTDRLKVPGWQLPQSGGVSGQPLKSRAEYLLSQFYKEARRRKQNMVFIGTGGIGSGEDLVRRILLGATVCRAYTAWVFEGPDFVKRALCYLDRFMQNNGIKTVAEMVGLAHKVEGGLDRFLWLE